MTKQQALDLYESKFWEAMTAEQIAKFQIMEPRLCMPFDVFQEAVEKTLGRGVQTIEFGLNVDGLKAELFDGAKPPSLEQIINLIPAEKRIVLLTA